MCMNGLARVNVQDAIDKFRKNNPDTSIASLGAVGPYHDFDNNTLTKGYDNAAALVGPQTLALTELGIGVNVMVPSNGNSIGGLGL